ncbi:hypothetical protein G6F56_003252 [Rhizopus delemar]|uniref:Uncharacterized protein n=1 Tax=Rhizopus stolonifer TaxID=4846 RepID=A0A367KXX5_RHIST|nr:hypothetical protein G6F56_003252 [Rhizopus delemar]RCI07035.1 hypothetical protein CU098_008492 [Rhizopus stolonifer]
MDLNWCIICDNRVDDVLNDSSLYCSESCKLKDQMTSISNQLYLNQQQKKPVVKAAPLKSKRLAAPSTSYPWVPLYRRRRGVVVSKRCQPVVASSPTTASALFTSFGQIVPTA